MQTMYRWNEDNLYFQSVEVDESGDLPTRGTFTPPPELEGEQVARWTGGGWEVLAAAPEIDPYVPTAEEVAKAYELAVQARLDAAAIAARYDSIATVISYAEEPAVPKFQNDGKAFRAWRSLVWAYAYEQLALVLAGGREQPTVDEFLAELPALELPV